MSPLAEVLDALARAVIPDGAGEIALGEIELHPHQVEAVRRVRVALREFGGALLADDPGLGKTYVALAIAAEYPRRIVAAPAALRALWGDAMRRTNVRCDFVSLESLSLGRAPAPAPFLIVDEAHRASATSAKRYDVLAALAHHARVLLLSATPVRNRRAELVALLAFFMGHDAHHVNDATLARCVIRRRADMARVTVPRSVNTRVMRPRGGDRIAAELRSLPPPLPLADGDSAAALVSMTLARCWASSVAALDRALWRRLQRGAALAAALDAGRLPSRAELSAWAVGDDAMQMAFPFVVSRQVDSRVEALRGALASHVEALEKLRTISRASRAADTGWRARRIRMIRARHPDAIIIAFTTSEATALALFSALRNDRGVVLLTGNEARSAAGPLHRADVLSALREDSRPPGLECRIVLATDLLAEGVNLQGASIIVHLDDPWTPSGVAQRIGRSARIGSKHGQVTVYRFAAPRAADALIRIGERHTTKRAASARALSPGASAEAIAEAVRAWRLPQPPAQRSAVATARAERAGILVRVDEGRGARLVAGLERGRLRWDITDDPARIRKLIEATTLEVGSAPTSSEITGASRAILGWLARKRASDGLARGSSAVARKRLLARLDALLALSTAAARPGLADRVGHIRRTLSRMRAAGVDRQIRALLNGSGGATEWLDKVERQLLPRREYLELSATAPEIVALLFLRRADCAARPAPAPSPAPPAASTETAAPR